MDGVRDVKAQLRHEKVVADSGIIPLYIGATDEGDDITLRHLAANTQAITSTSLSSPGLLPFRHDIGIENGHHKKLAGFVPGDTWGDPQSTASGMAKASSILLDWPKKCCSSAN